MRAHRLRVWFSVLLSAVIFAAGRSHAGAPSVESPEAEYDTVDATPEVEGDRVPPPLPVEVEERQGFGDPTYAPVWRSPWASRLWVRGEYIFGWTKSTRLPPLVTTSPLGTGPDVAGVLNPQTTNVLFGDQGAVAGLRSGGRMSFGYWITPDQRNGIEANYLGIARASTQFQDSGDDTRILARPVVDATTDQQAAMLVSYPGLLRGSIVADVTTELQSAEILWRRGLRADCTGRLDFLAGYRFGSLNEGLRVSQFSQWTAEQGAIIPGTTLQLFDDFSTQNQFHGVELGLICQEDVGRWELELLAKLALGNTHSIVSIDGATQIAVPNAGTASRIGGLLAQQTNIGHFEQDDFSILPELGMTVGYRLAPRLRLTAGYTLLYWTSVARPVGQIDPAVSQFPPVPPAGPHPAFTFSKSDFWAQGLNLGLDLRF